MISQEEAAAINADCITRIREALQLLVQTERDALQRSQYAVWLGDACYYEQIALQTLDQLRQTARKRRRQPRTAAPAAAAGSATREHERKHRSNNASEGNL